jgi:hypothetical protein
MRWIDPRATRDLVRPLCSGRRHALPSPSGSSCAWRSGCAILPATEGRPTDEQLSSPTAPDGVRGVAVSKTHRDFHPARSHEDEERGFAVSLYSIRPQAHGQASTPWRCPTLEKTALCAVVRLRTHRTHATRSHRAQAGRRRTRAGFYLLHDSVAP